MCRRILLHLPYPFPGKLESGSQVRPYWMHQAFLQLGYEVELVSGDVPTRWSKIRSLIGGNKRGQEFLFCYSEPSTYPVHPLLDYGFYLYAASRGIPIGLYYRDAYWRFPQWFPYQRYQGWRRGLLFLRYRLDLLILSRLVSVIFFQSKTMAALFSFSRARKAVLPPGGWTLYDSSVIGQQSKLDTAVYVGSISPRYGLDILLRAMERVNAASPLTLELVCRENQFVQQQQIWEPFRGAEWLRVHHLCADELRPVYQRSNFALFPLRRNPYNDFTLPVKLFEYMSYGLPIVATDCTEMANFIRSNKIGLIAEDNPESLAEKILQLVRDRDLYEELRHNVQRTLENGNLWTDRAGQVVKSLIPSQPNCL